MLAQSSSYSFIFAALALVAAVLLFTRFASKKTPGSKVETLAPGHHLSLNEFDETKARQIAEKFDLKRLPDNFYKDPFPYYHALRSFSPVHLMPDGSYFLTRYSDIISVYNNARAFSSDKKIEFAPKYGTDSLLFEHHTTSLVFSDPPYHTRVRRLLVGALSPRAIEAMEPGLIKRVDELLDIAEKKRNVDIIEDFASAIPIEIIGNLLDIPHDERGPLRQWSLDILGALEPTLTPQQQQAGEQSVKEFLAYLKDLIRRRREKPGDRDTDMLTRLMLGDPNGEKFTETELMQNCVFLLNAGHETTTNLIGNSLVMLSEWPDQKRLLLDNLDDPNLLKTAVEEFLRYESSNQLGNRRSTQDVTVGGVFMPAGTLITIGMGGANRDPNQFPEPDRLDLQRSTNKHVAFGSGIHQCAGMNLARLEGRIAVQRWLRRFPNYKLTGEPERNRRARFRGFGMVPCNVFGEGKEYVATQKRL
ncbi:putative cytochrome P450 hydroxylase [Gonapodya prolifera JEL478]|uniref:Putative cytochrome P450 hydroxylase n=1 Tax=Gonapodya prolifera (strain JEL478) TaxID=1344416 RepID=A0A138ZXM5_GONPJ|nr:putative cytochrome P450 hydroxylase [Gonapodya prolifera JEL478]|eukprot:KXS09252.1 putative cytochrome P450 hydroxylase [Gonapodya prolifera JEL478]